MPKVVESTVPNNLDTDEPPALIDINTGEIEKNEKNVDQKVEVKNEETPEALEIQRVQNRSEMHSAIAQLENLYRDKEVEVNEAQLKLSQCEKSALIVLRQLNSLQNRYLLDTISQQQTQIQQMQTPPNI